MKLFQRVLTAAFVLTVVLSAGNVLLANNHTDTVFHFNFTTQTQDCTDGRAKEDDSNCYLYSTTSKAHYIAYAEGVMGDGKYADCSNNFKYEILGCGEHIMRNWVYEWGKAQPNGKRVARIKAIQLDGARIVEGFWSPDSV